MISSNQGNYRIELSREPRHLSHCPSVDVMLQSMADNWDRKMLAVIMTGMGNDGASGIVAVKQKGGTVIAQNEKTCVVYGMPRAAYLTGFVDRMVPLFQLANEIVSYR